MSEEYLSLKRAASMLGVSPQALKRRIDRGYLPSYRSPTDLRVLLVRRADLEHYRVPRRVNGTTDQAA